MGSTPIGISGSRAAAVLGLSKYTTQVEVWQQICEFRRPGFNAERGYILEKFEGNASTRFGLGFESAVIELTENATGEKITDQEGEYFIEGPVPITCHIDGRLSPKKIYEGKTVYSRGFDMFWGTPGTDRIPQDYSCQVQHNMLCTGAEECHVSALVFPRSPQDWEDSGWRIEHESDDGDGEYILFNENKDIPVTFPKHWAETLDEMGYFHQYTVAAKPDAQKLLREAYDHFWQKYVLTETPPEIDDYEDIRRLFPAPVGTLVVPDSVSSMMREYKDIGKEIGAGGFLKKKQVQLKTDILKICLEKTTVADDESQEKMIFMDEAGNKCGSFNGTTFRA